MPTIDELPPAVSVSDTDEILVSQSDIARRATRAQLLAGVQPALAIPSGTLLGRLSAGIGAPETIMLGANLVVGNGALSAPSPFVIDGLVQGGSPMAVDQVPIGQGGQNAAISYAAFLGGLTTISGIDGSNITAAATGGALARRLADYFSDALTVESFGALGDGMTDDTAAFIAAVASAKPLQLSGRVYIINGPLLFANSSIVLGVPGATVVRRTHVGSTASWITVGGSSFQAEGVTFDAGALAGSDMPAVRVNASCAGTVFVNCGFMNTVGATAGCGLTISSAVATTHKLVGCTFANNGLHGVDVSGSGTLTIAACTVVGNGGAGIRIEAGVACVARENNCAENSIGISVGNWNVGAAPPGTGAGCLLASNLCSNNMLWGIAAAASGALISGNTIANNGTVLTGGGILARVGASRLSGNVVSGGTIGIDARACWGSALTGNYVSSTATGMAVGGGQSLVISDNVFLTNTWALLVSAIEPILSPLLTGPLSVDGNWIGFTSVQGGGIYVMDATQGVAIVDNDINGWGSATIDQAIWLHTDAAVLRRNRWNNQARFVVQSYVVAGLQSLVVPDMADDVLVTSAPGAIASVLTAHQADTLGQITFLKVSDRGAGYTQAQVSFAGSGTGASASAIVDNGQVIWLIVTNPGSGYGLIGSAATVTITGDGAGATAVAYVGLPVLEGRQLRLTCNCQVQLAISGSSPPQQSWTSFASTVPAFGAVDLEGVFGGWRAVAFPPVDYLKPTGDGGAILQSVGGGSVVLRPGSGGTLHLASAAEAVGCTSSVGRGSPLGIVSAPPGSDFRNLNGGAGNTFWVKQANADATGWIAIG